MVYNMVSEIFSCKRCGFCCHGETTVSLTTEDLKCMASTLNLSEEKVVDKYLRVTGNEIQMKIVDGHCIFYNDGCSVHEGRPWRCRQWPLHPAILKEEDNFNIIKDSCPGIKTDVSYQKFCDIMRLVERDYS